MNEPAPVEMDFPEAKAQLLAVLWGRDPLLCAREGLETLTRRNLELKDGDEILEALREQLVILEAVFVRYMGESAKKSNSAEARRCLAAIAMQAQRQFVATAAAVHALEQGARDAQAIEA